MIRSLLKLIVLVAVVHAAVKIAPVFWAHLQFRDALQQAARFSSRQDSEAIRKEVLSLAEDFAIPLASEAVSVEKLEQMTVIDARYHAELEYLPSRTYPWDFVIHIQEPHDLSPRFQ